MAEENIGLKK